MGSRSPRRERERRRSRSGSRDKTRHRSRSPRHERSRARVDRGHGDRREERSGDRNRRRDESDDRDGPKRRASRSPRRRRESQSPRRYPPPPPGSLPGPPPGPPPKSGGNCHRCGQPGHFIRDCPQQDRGDGGGGGGGGGGMRRSGDDRGCYKCGQKGHLARDCPSQGGGSFTERMGAGGDGHKWGKDGEDEGEKKRPVVEVEPDFGLSGKLAEEANTKNGVVMLYTQPPEARPPTKRWRLYVFKGQQQLDPLHIHRQSAYLFGRNRKVVDIPTDHPSCSQQHAVIQFRYIEQADELGLASNKGVVKPYLMDLGSTNGTFLNGERIEPQRYYELLEQDSFKFGHSSRDYVILHDQSAAQQAS